jgi:hypothetical protein
MFDITNNVRRFDQKIGLGHGSVNVSDGFRSGRVRAAPDFERRPVGRVDVPAVRPLGSGDHRRISIYVRNAGHGVGAVRTSGGMHAANLRFPA